MVVRKAIAAKPEPQVQVEKAGKVTHRFVQHDVHDFAWTADRRSARPLVETWTGPGSPTVTVQVLYPPEYEASAKPAMKAAKAVMARPEPFRAVSYSRRKLDAPRSVPHLLRLPGCRTSSSQVSGRRAPA